GLAAQSYHTARSFFPPGSTSKPAPGTTGGHWNLARWSSLTYLMQYMEQDNLRALLDTSQPLYSDDTFAVSPQNQQGVAMVIPEFLCPSDHGQVVSKNFGPSNYTACAGTGAGNGNTADAIRGPGSPIETDGIFFVNSMISTAHITDGTSKTALFSE